MPTSGGSGGSGAPSRGTTARGRGGGLLLKAAFHAPHLASARDGCGKVLQRYESTGAVEWNNVAATGVDFNTDDKRDGDVFYARNGFNPTRAKVYLAGRYLVDYTLVVDNAGATNTGLKCFATKNGGAALPGSHGAILSTTGITRGAGHGHFVVDLAANDYLEVFVQRANGTGSTKSAQNLSHLLVHALTFTDGGPVGAPYYCERALQVERVVVSKGVSGTSGSTTLRLKKNGSSVCTTDFTLGYATQADSFVADSYLSDPYFGPGDVMTFSSQAVEAPEAMDLRVEVFCRTIS